MLGNAIPWLYPYEWRESVTSNVTSKRIPWSGVSLDELKVYFRIQDSEESLSLPPSPPPDDGMPNSRDSKGHTWRDRKPLL